MPDATELELTAQELRDAESESVLDTEPIPLGHRQAIRKYFELIRPQNAEGEKDAPAPAK